MIYNLKENEIKIKKYYIMLYDFQFVDLYYIVMNKLRFCN